MNRVSVIVRNPAYLREVELDEDEVNPVDLVPLVSGDTPMISVPTSEDEQAAVALGEERLETKVKELRKEIMDLLSSISEDLSSLQSADVPQVEVWDTGKTWELEYRLHPDRSIDEISSRLSNQVWDLLRLLQERVDQRTYNNKDIRHKDIRLIDGLMAISVMHAQLGNLTEKALKH